MDSLPLLSADISPTSDALGGLDLDLSFNPMRTTATRTAPMPHARAAPKAAKTAGKRQVRADGC